MSAPDVSVVIASFRDPALLEACLQSVLPQADAAGAPVIVARAGGFDDAERLPSCANVTRVAAPAGASVPALRGAGLGAVRTPAAALVEDHCVAAPGWLDALVNAARGADVAGGAMGNARTKRAVEWAAYFAEYGFFASAREAGGRLLLTGANVLYGPAALARAARWSSEGHWEHVIHDRLARDGCRFAFAADAVVRQNQTYEVGAFCRDRYAHGLQYARDRLAEQPRLSRGLRAVTAPALPLVLAGRLAGTARPADRGAFLRALPLTLLFLGAWAAGEMAGYARGAPRP